MQLDYFRYMFDIQSFRAYEGLHGRKISDSSVSDSFFCFLTAFHVEPRIADVYIAMLDIVKEYITRSKYFTIDFQSKFVYYDVQLPEKPANDIWKQFFNETCNE
jgi:hypothetical protein